EVPGVEVKGKLKPAKEDPQTIKVDIDTTKADVGEIGKAIATTDTPHKAKVAPAAAVVVPVKGITKDASAKGGKAPTKVKGVDAKASSAGEGEAIVALSADGGAHLADIRKALKDLK